MTESEQIVADGDHDYFMQLIDLIPPSVYFNNEDKERLRKEDEDGEGDEQSGKRKKKKKNKDPINTGTITSLQASLSAIDEKIRARKESKKNKRKTKEGKEQETNGGGGGGRAGMQALQEKLQARIKQLQSKGAKGLSATEQQEQKRLQRKQRALNQKNKHKNKKGGNKPTANGDVASVASTPVVAKRPSKPIVNKEGKMVFSKFDFKQSDEKEKPSGSLVGKDYKRLLAKLEQRDAKVAQVKERDPEAAERLQQKHVWQDVLSKAKGEKVKDDPGLLKKALKRKEKVKNVRGKKWEERKASVDKAQAQRQEKREKNLQSRKDEKKAKHRKKLIKKGRILPGF